MGLTSALFAGLSGMKTNEFTMDVIGHNIANVNTYGFKASKAGFQSQFSNTFSFGSAPTATSGGSNPLQVGTGTMVGGVQRDFGDGAPEVTGIKTNLAIQGQGLFIVERPDGSVGYSRDGNFQFNAENYLITSDGYFLQGFGVDSSFTILEGTLTNLRIPIGEITTASTTTEACFSGNLNADGNDATEQAAAGNQVRPTLYSQTLTDTGAGGPLLTAGTLLTDLDNGSGPVVVDGNIITLAEAVKGGQTLPEETFNVTATSTLGEFLAWLEDVMGINTSSDLPDYTADGVPDPGINISATNDSIEIVGNIGNHNALDLGNQAIKITKGTAAGIPGDSLPFTFTEPSGFSLADVESVRTSFRAYDSLGIPMDIDVTMVMESKTAGGGITWRYFAESSDDSDADRVVGTGTISFDANGNYLEGDNLSITIDREDSGASTPQAITLDFSRLDSYAMTNAISLLSQDGFQAGTLQDYAIGADGVIVGSFDNGLTREMGQVVLATFRNYEGLVVQGDNLWTPGPNSGQAIIKKPSELGAGSISPASLELSNVDLSREFINLIISSTGFSASSRVIQTSDQLLNELMLMTR
ncbi:MAG: flagellar hook-basal body complex protein [Sedimentisphaerales bacterium]|nr:flagellar hook-basal body complex protein [Sedimentisphaerales bacterium]